MCCSPWGHKESDMTESLNSTDFSQTPMFDSDPPAALASEIILGYLVLELP